MALGSLENIMVVFVRRIKNILFCFARFLFDEDLIAGRHRYIGKMGYAAAVDISIDIGPGRHGQQKGNTEQQPGMAYVTELLHAMSYQTKLKWWIPFFHKQSSIRIGVYFSINPT